MLPCCMMALPYLVAGNARLWLARGHVCAPDGHMLLSCWSDDDATWRSFFSVNLIPAGHSSVPLWAADPPPARSLPAVLASQRVAYSVCSPYAALSGKGDAFASMDELVRSVRSGVLLDVAAVPSVSLTDRHGEVR